MSNMKSRSDNIVFTKLYADMTKKRRTIIGAAAAGIIPAGAVLFGQLEMLHPVPRPRKSQKRVACIGDSITYGCFVPGWPWNSYPCRLGKKLGKGYCVGNFGYTNRTAIADADFPYTAEKLYRKSLDFMPDIVLIMLGTNDTKPYNWDREKYRADMSALIDSYKDLASRPEVILMVPIPAEPFLGKVRWDIRSEIIEDELVPICRELAETKGLKLINVHDAFSGRGPMLVDGIHPGAKGADLIAETVYRELVSSII